MNNKILLTGLVLASLAGTSMAAGVNNTVDPNAAGYGAESYGKSNTINATGTSSFAVGFENTVSGANSLVYGHNNKATGANSFAGGENSEAEGYSSLAIGSSAQALSDYTFAIGSQARTNGANTVAVGNGAYASNTNALAVGYSTAANGKDSLAVGSFVKSNSDNNVAIGTSVTTNSNDSVGIGTAVTTNSNNSVGIGNNVTNNLSNSIGIGNGVATDFNTIGIGNGVETKVKDTIAVGNGVISKGESSVAIGNAIHADGVRTVNIGTNVSATGVSSIIVGRDTTVNGDDTTVVGANNGTVDAAQSAVYGYNNKVLDNSKEQLIFGVNSQTKGQGSVVVGSHASATEIDALALGNNTIADVQNGVAIGTNSVTESPVGTSTVKDNATDIRFSNSTFAGATPDSVVSFGTHGRAGAGGVTEYTRQLQNLAAGRVSATSTDGINGSQLYDVALEAQKHNTLVDGTNTTVTSQDNNFGRKEYKVNVNKTLKDMDAVEFGKESDDKRAGINKDGVYFFNGSENINIKPTGIQIENTDTLTQATFNNEGMQVSDDNATIRFTTTNISAGGQQIHDVKAGTKDTDAVNVKQLNDKASSLDKAITYNTFNINKNAEKIGENKNNITKNASDIKNLGDKVNKNTSDIKSLDDKINVVGEGAVVKANNYTDKQVAKVGANAAALSALHPLDFNADEKWQFSVGFGNYKGKNATALGAFYQPNENVLLSVGTTLGTGENMINAGATVRFGSHSSMTTNKQVAVAKEVQDLKLQLSAISQKYDNLVKNLSAQKAGQDVDFEYSDLPKDHWAYDFVKKLSDKGYLNGYPDGTFKGDTKMTRYEFAAALWRAVNNGAIIDAQMAKAIKEFEPELEEVNKIMRYHIDTVAGKDNSVHKTERLRVNKNDDPFTHMKRDDYGTKTYTNK
jgi:hypothetical protein